MCEGARGGEVGRNGNGPTLPTAPSDTLTDPKERAKGAHGLGRSMRATSSGRERAIEDAKIPHWTIQHGRLSVRTEMAEIHCCLVIPVSYASGSSQSNRGFGSMGYEIERYEAVVRALKIA